MTKYLLPDLEEFTRLIHNLPMLEFAVGSLGLSRRQALIEMGFPEEKVDELMAERRKEDETTSDH